MVLSNPANDFSNPLDVIDVIRDQLTEDKPLEDAGTEDVTTDQQMLKGDPLHGTLSRRSSARS